PSVCKGKIPVVAPAPAEWAARLTTTLAKQLPAPSVPTRIFLVEKFVMKPVSGKIDRNCLPKLSHLLKTAEAGPLDMVRAEVESGDADTAANPDCEIVLAVCRAVLERPLGLDDGFVEAGAHSIDIARLAQRLQAAGWMVTVRALLSDCNTARKVASRSRVLE